MHYDTIMIAPKKYEEKQVKLFLRYKFQKLNYIVAFFAGRYLPGSLSNYTLKHYASTDCILRPCHVDRPDWLF